MRSSYKIYDPDGIYMITSTIIEWAPLFTEISYFNILLDSMKFCQIHKDLKIFAYVIMDNHFHMICQSKELSKTIQSMKRHTARQIIIQLRKDEKKWLLNLMHYNKLSHKKECDYQVWQEGFHPKQILSDNVFRQKVEYIHYNPVRRGLVEKPEHWMYSSASAFAGRQGVICLDECPV